jgi:RecA/RadA recombinase
MAKKSKADEMKSMLTTPKMVRTDTVWFTTGSALIDEVAGAGRGLGFESGGIVNICGQSGSGKSYLSIETLANAIHTFKDRLKYRIADTEGGALFNTEKLYGFTVDPKCAPTVKTVEDFQADALNFIESVKEGEVGLYIVDSWDGLTGSEIEERADDRQKAYTRGIEYEDKSFLGGKNKFASSELFPTLVSKLQGRDILFVITSQVRENIGAGLYAPKFKVTGGGALLFFSSVRLWLKPNEKFEENGLSVGVSTHIEAKKSRGDRPFRSCLTTIWFSYGIDNVDSCINYLYDLYTDTGKMSAKANKELTWDDEILDDKEALIKYIEANNLESELYKRTHDLWEKRESDAVASLAGRKKRF